MRKKAIRLSLALSFTQELGEGMVSSEDSQHSGWGVLADAGPGASHALVLFRERL